MCRDRDRPIVIVKNHFSQLLSTGCALKISAFLFIIGRIAVALYIRTSMRPIVTDGVATGLSVCLSVCLSVTIVSPAKTAEPIKIQFVLWTRVHGSINGSMY